MYSKLSSKLVYSVNSWKTATNSFIPTKPNNQNSKKKEERSDKKTNFIVLKPLVIRWVENPFDIRLSHCLKRGIDEDKFKLLAYRVWPFIQLFLQNPAAGSEPMKA